MAFPFLTDRLSRLGPALLIVSVLLTAMGSAQANTPMPESEFAARNEAVVRKAFENWASGQGNVFDLLAPDIVWTIHGSGPVADTYNGVEDFVRRGSGPLVSRLSRPLVPEVHNIWAFGDTVVVRFNASSTTTSGNPYRNQFVWIFRMENGSVVEAEAFLDLVAYQNVIDNNQPRRD